jgi:hypothetical protein
MTAYAHHEFDEIVLFTAKVHDLQKGNNWTAEIRGTEDDAWYQWHRCETLLAKAGFVSGWRPNGVYRGSIDHLILLKEAADREWLQRAPDLVP